MGRLTARKSFGMAAALLTAAIVVELGVLMALNGGHLVYTLDDPYIHLALAENIVHGHYGVNTADVCAPSSSIVWPYILAPFTRLGPAVYAPLVLNVFCAIATVYVFFRIAVLACGAHHPGLLLWVQIALILATNTIGLVFMGMEHSLQLLITAAVAFGLALESTDGKVTRWLAFAIVFGPLVRYENMAISAAAILYLLLRQHYRLAATLLALVVLLMGAFSVYLITLGLDPIPTSITAKSAVIDAHGRLSALRVHFRKSLSTDRGAYLTIFALAFLAVATFGAVAARRSLALSASCAICLHMMAGEYGWYYRYEIYVWAFAVLVLLYLSGDWIKGLLSRPDATVTVRKIVGVSGLALLLVCPGYVGGLRTIPIASNNIYEQQYQMHRFAVDFYKKPVAVNDLGYVSWRNDNYVLDLFGLGSRDALKFRLAGAGPGWMDDLARASGVELAMIYDDVFPKGIPGSWIKLGELHLGKRLITPATPTVAFYAVSGSAADETRAALDAFRRTLPAGVTFTVAQPPALPSGRN
jgi:hypothetical protein